MGSKKVEGGAIMTLLGLSGGYMLTTNKGRHFNPGLATPKKVD
jgi:hypothetical protein